MRHLILLSSTLFSTSLLANISVHWDLAMNWNSTLSPISSPPYKVAELVKQMTNGRFTITIDGKEKLDQTENLLSMVQENNYQMIYSSAQNWKDLDVNTIWFTSIPFGMTATEQFTWFYYGNGSKYMKKVYDKLNVLSYPAGNLGPLSGGWFNKEINSIGDFKNLQMNVQGISKEILSVYGIDSKEFQSSDIVQMYNDGKLDVISGTTPSMDTKLGYHKVAHYYYTSWDMPSYQMEFLINKETFNKLPKNYQTILKTAMKIAAHEVYYKNFDLSSKAWEKILEEYPNIKVKSLPKDVLQKLKQSKEFIFQSYANDNELFKEIYKDQNEFIKRVRKWSNIQEYKYLETTNTLD